MSASLNVNFPPGLNITASTVCANSSPAFGRAAQEDAISKYGIAGRVWEAAYSLISYLREGSVLELDPPFIFTRSSGPFRVVELGSGTGIVASELAATILRPGVDKLFATDLPDVCPLLEENLLRSPGRVSDCVSVRSLAWGACADASALATELGSQSLTHIICSDLIYLPSLLGPLLRSLICLTSPPFAHSSNQSATLLISHQVRSLPKETAFWSAFGLWFQFRPVLRRTDGGFWERFVSSSDQLTFIFIAYRKAESYAWSVPSSDDELLGGVGTLGSNSAKGDDTFETLLLMMINDGVDGNA